MLLDEPLSALDPFLRLRMRSELKRLQRELGISFVHVTHSQDEALALADLIIVMNNGMIEQAGPAMVGIGAIGLAVAFARRDRLGDFLAMAEATRLDRAADVAVLAGVRLMFF